MYKYKLGERLIQSKDKKGIVTRLRHDCYQSYQSNADYMEACAKRLLILKNELIRRTDESVFVDELVRVGVLEIG